MGSGLGGIRRLSGGKNRDDDVADEESDSDGLRDEQGGSLDEDQEVEGDV